DRLRACMPELSVHRAFIMKGYDIGAGMDGAQDILEARQRRMQESPALACLDPGVSAGMMTHLMERSSHMRHFVADLERRFGKQFCEEGDRIVARGRKVSQKPAAQGFVPG